MARGVATSGFLRVMGEKDIVLVINQLLYLRTPCSAARRYCKWLNNNEISSSDILLFPGFAHCVCTSRTTCGGMCSVAALLSTSRYPLPGRPLQQRKAEADASVFVCRMSL